MNKSIAILASLVVLGSAASSMAALVGVVNLNSWDSATVIMPAAGQTLDATSTYVEVLASVAGGAFTPVPTSSGATSFLIGDTAGDWDAGVGVVPGAAANGSVTFEVQAWSGAATFDAAPYKATSAQWTQTVGSWDNAAQPPATQPSIALNVPGNLQLTNAPEPSTIALGLLGAAALLIRRRK